MAGINHIIESPEDHIQKLINQIIQTMYMPVADDRQFVMCTDIAGTRIAEDAINWGNLRCIDVVTHGKGYTATIEEADPGARNLCRYIEGLLQSWGWNNVTVETEW